MPTDGEVLKGGKPVKVLMRCPGCGTADYRPTDAANPCATCGYPENLPKPKVGATRPDGTWEPPVTRPLGWAAIPIWGLPAAKALLYAGIVTLLWMDFSELQRFAGYTYPVDFEPHAQTWIMGVLAVAVVLVLIDLAVSSVAATAYRQGRTGWGVYLAIGELLPFVALDTIFLIFDTDYRAILWTLGASLVFPVMLLSLWGGRYRFRPWFRAGRPFL